MTGKDEIIKILRRDYGQIIEKCKKVLCVQPHPDDCDIAIGGTIYKLSSKGAKITYATLTDGRIGTYDPNICPEKLAKIRMIEQENAAKKLGVNKLVWFNYHDSELYPSIEIRNKIIRLIREVRPDIVFTTDPWLTYEAHPDHRTTGLMTSEAVLFSGFPHINPEDIREGFKEHNVSFIGYFWTRKPNTFIDISDVFERKIEAIKEHKSQYPNSIEKFENILKKIHQYFGSMAGYKYAESIKILPTGFLHSNIFAEDI